MDGSENTHMHCVCKELMKNVSTLFHELDVLWKRVPALPVTDWVHKAIGELMWSSKEVGLDKVHHGVVCSRRQRKR